MRIPSATIATRLATLLEIAKVRDAPDPDQEAVVMTAIVEATDAVQDQDLTLVEDAVATVTAEIADTLDPPLVTTIVIDAVAVEANPVEQAVTEATAEEALLLKREAPQATKEVLTLRMEASTSEIPILLRKWIATELSSRSLFWKTTNVKF